MTTYKVSADGGVQQDTNQDTHTMLVRIWDLGPDAPLPPVKPDLPTAKEGTPAHDLAMIDFEGALANYKTALAEHSQAKRDHATWHRTYEGPYQIEMYSVDAREAIAIQPDRYVLELPKGRKAGKYQTDQMQRQKEAQRTFAQTIARDPVFGNQGAQP